MKTQKSFLSILIVLNFYSTCFGQKLERKASLGIGVITLNDSIVQARNLKVKQGALVSRLVPNTTASELGILEGDVITEINDQNIEDRSRIFAIARAMRENDPLEISYIRDGKRKIARGKALGKPAETSGSGLVTYGQVEYEADLLRTIIHRPLQTEKTPAIFFLQGIYCGSQDFWAAPTEPAKLLVDDFVQAGFTVYRVERPGVGDSEGTTPCSDLTYPEELALHEEAYKNFLSLPYVNTSQVFLFGHSMGAVTAPLLNEIHQPRGIVVYGAVFKTWYEYFIDNFREQPRFYGVETTQQIDSMVRNSLPILHQWLIEGRSPDEIRNDPYNKSLVSANLNVLNYSEDDYFFGRHYNFWYTINQVNNANSWSRVKSDVLAMYGKADIQALSSESARDIATLVNEVNPGHGSYIEIAEADHSFAQISSKEEGAKLNLDGEYFRHIRNNYNRVIADESIAWMKNLLSDQN